MISISKIPIQKLNEKPGFHQCHSDVLFLFPFSEENEKPADLSQRVIFKSKRTDKVEEGQGCDSKEKSKKRPQPAKNKLSFQDAEDENEDDE